MKKFHKTDWNSYQDIPVRVIKDSDLYNSKNLGYNRNKEKREINKIIRNNLEKLALGY